jgi:predicted small secreted protein
MQEWAQRVMALIVLTAFVVGCNTVEGFGRDLGKLGDKIEQKAEQKRSY